MSIPADNSGLSLLACFRPGKRQKEVLQQGAGYANNVFLETQPTADHSEKAQVKESCHEHTESVSSWFFVILLALIATCQRCHVPVQPLN